MRSEAVEVDSTVGASFAVQAIQKGDADAVLQEVENNGLVSANLDLRKMMYIVSSRELDEVDYKFILRPESELKDSIRGFSHARRIWLSVKFCRLLKGAKTSDSEAIEFRSRFNATKICRLFGIGRSVVVKFLTDKRTSFKTFVDYKYLSPLECNFNKMNMRDYIKNASNLRSLISQGYFDEKRVKRCIKKMGLNVEKTLADRT